MGMYDTMNFRMDCPYCGTVLRDFQTKDQEMPRMDILRPYQPIETKWVERKDKKSPFPLDSIVLRRVTNWYMNHNCGALGDKEIWVEWFVGEKGAHCEVKFSEDKIKELREDEGSYISTS